MTQSRMTRSVSEEFPLPSSIGRFEDQWVAGADAQEKHDLVEQGEGRRYYLPDGTQITWFQALELIQDPTERIVGRTPVGQRLVSTVFTCLDIRSREEIPSDAPLLYETLVFEVKEGRVDVTPAWHHETREQAEMFHLEKVVELMLEEEENNDD